MLILAPSVSHSTQLTHDEWSRFPSDKAMRRRTKAKREVSRLVVCLLNTSMTDFNLFIRDKDATYKKRLFLCTRPLSWTLK